jgi:hypothetical protein
MNIAYNGWDIRISGLFKELYPWLDNVDELFNSYASDIADCLDSVGIERIIICTLTKDSYSFGIAYDITDKILFCYDRCDLFTENYGLNNTIKYIAVNFFNKLYAKTVEGQSHCML